MKRMMIAVTLVLLFSLNIFGLTIYADNFDDNGAKVPGWKRSSTSYVSRYTGSYKKGVAALRVRKTYNAITYIKVSPFKNMVLKFKMAAKSLESGEYLRCYIDTGSGWKTAKTLYNGSDNGVYRSYSVSIANCNVLKIKFAMKANSTSDYGYIDDLILTGVRK